LKLVIISDSHGMYRDVEIPEGDVLVHCGDIFRSAWPNSGELLDFKHWLRGLPHKHKILIAGNHEKGVERDGFSEYLLPECTYLENSGVEIQGIKFWGSPYTPEFMNWAFMRDRGAPMKEIWDQIPQNTDVLITHGPPKGIMDKCPDGFHAGCEELYAAVHRINPTVHCFGHIHGGYGRQWGGCETLFVNASICTEAYRPTNKAQVVEI